MGVENPRGAGTTQASQAVGLAEPWYSRKYSANYALASGFFGEHVAVQLGNLVSSKGLQLDGKHRHFGHASISIAVREDPTNSKSIPTNKPNMPRRSVRVVTWVVVSRRITVTPFRDDIWPMLRDCTPLPGSNSVMKGAPTVQVLMVVAILQRVDADVAWHVARSLGEYGDQMRSRSMAQHRRLWENRAI